MSPDAAPIAAAALAVMASPRRCEILRLVWARELPAGDIHRTMPDVTFGAVSIHLRALREAGLVESRAEGQQRFYRARREAFGALGQELERMWEGALWRLKLQAELEHARRGPRQKRRRTPKSRERKSRSRS